MKKYFFLLFNLFFVQIFAQSEEIELSVNLKNGDILTGITELRTIAFKTDYGTLNFPIDQVSSIEIGLKDSRFDKGNLLNLLTKLETGSDKEKEQAFDEILKMDEGAIPFIKAYLSSSNNATNSSSDLNVQTLYEVMLAKYKVSRNYSLQDILTYNNEFRVEGSFDFSELLLKTNYGLIKVTRNDIARVDVKIVTQGFSNNNTFKLFANQHISGNKDDGWLNTGILLKKGDIVNIQANGQIVLASLSGNTYTADGGVNGSAGIESNKPSYGQVVFKISQGGIENKAGNNYTGAAAQTGILYLAIYESVFNSANAGYYSVNIKVD